MTKPLLWAEYTDRDWEDDYVRLWGARVERGPVSIVFTLFKRPLMFVGLHTEARYEEVVLAQDVAEEIGLTDDENPNTSENAEWLTSLALDYANELEVEAHINIRGMVAEARDRYVRMLKVEQEIGKVVLVKGLNHIELTRDMAHTILLTDDAAAKRPFRLGLLWGAHGDYFEDVAVAYTESGHVQGYIGFDPDLPHYASNKRALHGLHVLKSEWASEDSDA